MGDSPSLGRSNQTIFVSPSHDEVRRTGCRLADVLGLQVATAGRLVTIDSDLVVRHHVLTHVEVLERSSNPRLDGVTVSQGFGQIGSGIGQEHAIEVVPVLRVEGIGVRDGQIDDGLTVEELRQRITHVRTIDGARRVRLST